jgi:cytochrome c-type biogenesis protein
VPWEAKLRQQRRAADHGAVWRGYGVASLGCTLPVFLALWAPPWGAGGPVGSLTVFAAYGVGMALVLMALSIAAALLQEGLARRLLPYMPQVTGGLW